MVKFHIAKRGWHTCMLRYSLCYKHVEYNLFRVKYYEDKATRKNKSRDFNKYIFFSPRKRG